MPAGGVFYERVRGYWPGLPDNSLVPDFAGIRPKITGPGEPQADFMIDAPEHHGVPGWCSSSASSRRPYVSLSLGEEVAGYLSS
jgi:hypothetical protein